MGIILFPFISPQFFARIMILALNYTVKEEAIEIMRNYYITVFIYPAILLLFCQENSTQSNIKD